MVQSFGFGFKFEVGGQSSTFFDGKKKLECPVVSQICTLWPLRFHHEFSLMQTECPDIPSFAHFDKYFFWSDATHVQMVTLQPPSLTRQPPSVTLHIC